MTEPRRRGLLRWRTIADLTVAPGYPCISVLVPTTPAPRMLDADRHLMTALVGQAESELEHHELSARGRLMSELRDLADQVADEPAESGRALYVSLATRRSLVLPISVAPRAVVEPTFATRDLMRALHATPPHLILTLHPEVAHLFHAQGMTMTWVASTTMSTDTTRHLSTAEPSPLATDTFLAEVDYQLGQHRLTFPSPLVLAGPEALLDTFTQHSSHLERLAGQLDTARYPTPADILRGSSIALEKYLISRQHSALALVRQTLEQDPQRVATGIAEVSLECRRRPPLMLAVETSFAVPGQHTDQPLTEPADTNRAPRVHDLVDDLIEIVIHRGGWIALVDDGALGELQHIALVSRGS
jgi:hypothetical protein